MRDPSHGYWDDFTHDVLARSGLAPGMRVLDIGCGAGDPALIAASLVGPGGCVVAVDRHTRAIEEATRRAAGAELANIEVVASELRDFEPGGRFDALIGRFILQHLPDPAATLRRLTPALHPGAIVSFIEMDWLAARTTPSVPLVDDVLELTRDTLRRASIALDVGPRLWRIVRTIGVRNPEIRVGARAEPAPAAEGMRMLASTAHELLPMMERFGLAGATNVSAGSLAQRMQDALIERQAAFISPSAVAAFGRIDP